jgi:hypothetical protein
MFAVYGSRLAIRLQRQPSAGLHHGHNRHGSSNDPGSDRHISTHGPGSIFGDNPTGHSRYDVGPGAVGLQPRNAGDIRELCDADTANRIWKSGRTDHFHVGNKRCNCDDNTDFGSDDAGVDHDDASDAIGDHSDAYRRQLDRDRSASAPGRQPTDRCMQL